MRRGGKEALKGRGGEVVKQDTIPSTAAASTLDYAVSFWFQDTIKSLKEQETLVNAEEQCESLIKSKMQLEARVKALSGRVEEEEEINSELTARGRKREDECSELKRGINDLETILAKAEKCAAEHKISHMSSGLQIP
ncbi:hypothetical protein STEG23_037253 [Scotinomys teguina]